MQVERVERLVAEFEVEKIVDKGYGYEEKYLLFKGVKIPYKAIIKKGALIAIVSRKYHLIPNELIEELCKQIAERRKWKIVVDKTETSIHVSMGRDGVGVVVANRVDGYGALRVDLYITINGAKVIYKIKKDDELEQVYKKHYKGAKIVIDDLEKIVDAVLSKVDDLKYLINRMDKIQANKIYDELKILEDLIPKKYIQTAMRLLQYRVTLKQFYSKVASEIWSADISMDTKIRYFDYLNNITFAIVAQ